MIHGVTADDGRALSANESEKVSQQVIGPTGGKLTDGKDEWKFEYKPIINSDDVMIDVKKEFDSLGDIYKDLMASYPDRLKKAGKPVYKQHLQNFKDIQNAVKQKMVKQVRAMKSVYGPEGGDVEGVVFRDLEDDSLAAFLGF